MSDEPRFAHGYHYGDDAGVVFYGPPVGGCWDDRLAISNCFLRPLFLAMLEPANPVEMDKLPVPRMVKAWNVLDGWSTATGRVPVNPEEGAELLTALSQLTASDVAPYCSGCSVEEAVACARALAQFLESRLVSGSGLSIEVE